MRTTLGRYALNGNCISLHYLYTHYMYLLSGRKFIIKSRSQFYPIKVLKLSIVFAQLYIILLVFLSFIILFISLTYFSSLKHY